MLYMVIERFKDAPSIYRRLNEKGRMMPPRAAVMRNSFILSQ